MYSGISNLAEFKEALLAPIRDVKIRVTSLNINLTPVEEVTASTIEGTVYVDTSRATRRTCQLRFIDKDGAYTPKDASSVFYWDKLIKIEYGLKVGADYTYVPLGIFTIDRSEIVAENGAAVINIDGSDQWDTFSMASFGEDGYGWPSGTSINTIITETARYLGSLASYTAFSKTIVGVPPERITLDPLASRLTPQTVTSVAIKYKAGDNIGDSLKKWASDWSIDIYFDVNGNLVTHDMTLPPYSGTSNSAPDATFTVGENAVMLGIQKAQSSHTIYNHIIVTGDNADGNAAVRGEYIEGVGTNVDTSPLKRFYTGRANTGLSVGELGDKTLVIRTTTLKTSQQCLDRARVELSKNLTVEESIQLPLIANPLFEGYDVIQISEKNTGLEEQKYTLDSFDIPMRSSRQVLNVKKMRAL
jgi:hypothetical protein